MPLNVGDQVKFLNAVGKGVVTRVIDSRMVLIRDENGFEIPTLISELLKIEPADAGSRFFIEPDQIPVPNQTDLNDPDSGNNTPVDLLDRQVIRNRKSEDILLAFVPHDQKWMITGLVDILLVNNTSFDIIYNLFHRTPTGHFLGIDYGSVFANSRHLIDTVTREKLTNWTNGYLQFLFHKEQVNQIMPPFNTEFQIDEKKFQQEGAYRESPLIKDKGIIIRIVSISDYSTDQKNKKKPEKEPERSKSDPEVSLICRHQTLDREAVVDLHIHELIDDPSNLESTEILGFQKNYFICCLDQAIVNHFRKVIFIHGVGNGILRNTLIDHLKKTESLEWFDAPMSEYGMGAIEVRIYQNR